MATFISDSAVTKLNEHLSGDLLQPKDPAYDDARTVWNRLSTNLPR